MDEQTSHDPGITLARIFAFLAESLVFRAGAMPPEARAEIFRMLAAFTAVAPAPGADALLTRNRYFAGKMPASRIYRLNRITVRREASPAQSPFSRCRGRQRPGSQRRIQLGERRLVILDRAGYAIGPDGEELLVTHPLASVLATRPSPAFARFSTRKTSTPRLRRLVNHRESSRAFVCRSMRPFRLTRLRLPVWSTRKMPGWWTAVFVRSPLEAGRRRRVRYADIRDRR